MLLRFPRPCQSDEPILYFFVRRRLCPPLIIVSSLMMSLPLGRRLTSVAFAPVFLQFFSRRLATVDLSTIPRSAPKGQ